MRDRLGAMVAAGVVEADPITARFTLPAEHAAYLTRAAAADNLAVFTQYIGLLGGVEDDIVECFELDIDGRKDDRLPNPRALIPWSGIATEASRL